MTKLNTGLSGCSLELINDRVLRKYSPTTDYNSRLLSQADKQVVFGNRIYKNIDAHQRCMIYRKIILTWSMSLVRVLKISFP